MEDLLKKILESGIHDTKLDSQIVFIEAISQMVKTPLTLSILESLKELRGIKQNRIIKMQEDGRR